MNDVVHHAMGDIVYLKISPEYGGMVTGLMFRPTGVTYYITWQGAAETCHYDIELTTEKQYNG